MSSAFDILRKLRTGAQAADRWLSLSKPTVILMKAGNLVSSIDDAGVFQPGIATDVEIAL